MRGGEAPALIFVWPSPTRVGAAEDEVMGGDDLLGLRNAPPPRLSSSDLTSFDFFPDIFVKKTFNWSNCYFYSLFWLNLGSP